MNDWAVAGQVVVAIFAVIGVAWVAVQCFKGIFE